MRVCAYIFDYMLHTLTLRALHAPIGTDAIGKLGMVGMIDGSALQLRNPISMHTESLVVHTVPADADPDHIT